MTETAAQLGIRCGLEKAEHEAVRKRWCKLGLKTLTANALPMVSG